MDKFSKEIAVGKETRLFQFTHMKNMNGTKFFITSHDENKKAISFSLTKKDDGEWRLVPGSARWLYAIEPLLAEAIMDTRTE